MSWQFLKKAGHLNGVSFAHMQQFYGIGFPNLFTQLVGCPETAVQLPMYLVEMSYSHSVR